MSTKRITLVITGDTVDGLWATEDGDQADNLAEHRVGLYLDHARAACRAAWPDVEIITDDSQLACYGATRRDTIEVQGHESDYWYEDHASEDVFQDILRAAYESACDA